MQDIINTMKCIVLKIIQGNKVHSKNNQPHTSDNGSFFSAASWQDDRFSWLVASRNRYQIAFLAALGIIAILGIGYVKLLPLKTLIPIEVRIYDDGHVTVLPTEQTLAPINRAQTESDIVRYLLAREGYHAKRYTHDFETVIALSAKKVGSDYASEQDFQNENSFIARLGVDGERKVSINSLHFIQSKGQNDPENPRPVPYEDLIQVDFTVTEIINQNERTQQSYRALVSWAYKGTPMSAKAMWQNWSGFAITYYHVEPLHSINNNRR